MAIPKWLRWPSYTLVNCCENISQQPRPQNKCIKLDIGPSGCWSKKDESHGADTNPICSRSLEPTALSPGQPSQVAVHPTAFRHEDKCWLKLPSFGVFCYVALIG